MCPADESLLDVLRNRLNMTGSKKAVEQGLWRLQYHHGWPACLFVLVLGAEAEGRTIETVEGLSEGGTAPASREVH